MDPLKPVIYGLAKPLNSSMNLETMNLLHTNIITEISHNDKINKNNQKIKKDSIGITKTHEKNIKSKKEKIKKDYIEITKTHKKNIKSIKCLKTNNCKKQ